MDYVFGKKSVVKMIQKHPFTYFVMFQKIGCSFCEQAKDRLEDYCDKNPNCILYVYRMDVNRELYVGYKRKVPNRSDVPMYATASVPQIFCIQKNEIHYVGGLHELVDLLNRHTLYNKNPTDD